MLFIPVAQGRKQAQRSNNLTKVTDNIKDKMILDISETE
jgi:hypothetical protein